MLHLLLPLLFWITVFLTLVFGGWYTVKASPAGAASWWPWPCFVAVVLLGLKVFPLW